MTYPWLNEIKFNRFCSRVQNWVWKSERVPEFKKLPLKKSTNDLCLEFSMNQFVLNQYIYIYIYQNFQVICSFENLTFIFLLSKSQLSWIELNKILYFKAISSKHRQAFESKKISKKYVDYIIYNRYVLDFWKGALLPYLKPHFWLKCL